MKNEREIIVLTALIVMSFLGTSIGVAAEPTIGEVTLNPEKPTPQSNVTFSVAISGDGISSVRLWIEECKSADICYLPQNVSMNVVNDKYEAKITLAHADASYITYHVEVNYAGGFIKSKDVELNLAEKPNGDHNSNSNGNTGNKTPGFELVLFIVAVGLGFILLRRKRL